MNGVLDAPELERVLDVVEACERPVDLETYRATTLDALATTAGFGRSTFFLTGPLEPPTTGTDGIQHGFRPSVMEHYMDEHAADPFRGDAAVRILADDGLASLDQLLPRLSPRERRYVDGFLEPNGIRSQLCLWLDTGQSTQGVVCVLDGDERAFGARDRAVLLALRPHLANLLAQHLRRQPDLRWVPDLSPREREVVGLVAEGRTNAEIARQLAIGEDTVKKHVSRALAVCGARNRTELTLRWRTG